MDKYNEKQKECCDLNEVVNEFYTFLKAYLTKKTKDASIAEDLVQEVMLKLVESHQKSVAVKHIKAWLFQVARNTLADFYDKKHLTYNLEDDWMDSIWEDEGLPKILALDYVVPMIELLPKEYAEPLKMSDIEYVPQQEIATRLGLGLSATKMRIQRGRRKLQALFVECCHIQYDSKGNFTSCTIKSSCAPLKDVEKDIHSKVRFSVS